MKIAILTALAALGAFGQSAERPAAEEKILDANVPSMLSEHDVRSAILATGNYEIFRRSAANIPTAARAMEQQLARAKMRGDEDVAMDIKHFHAALFDLRYFYTRTTEALQVLRTELTVKYFATGDRFPLSNQECAAADQWLEETTKDAERSFVAAMARYDKTSRKVDRYLDRHHL